MPVLVLITQSVTEVARNGSCLRLRRRSSCCSLKPLPLSVHPAPILPGARGLDPGGSHAPARSDPTDGSAPGVGSGGSGLPHRRVELAQAGVQQEVHRPAEQGRGREVNWRPRLTEEAVGSRRLPGARGRAFQLYEHTCPCPTPGKARAKSLEWVADILYSGTWTGRSSG